MKLVVSPILSLEATKVQHTYTATSWMSDSICTLLTEAETALSDRPLQNYNFIVLDTLVTLNMRSISAPAN